MKALLLSLLVSATMALPTVQFASDAQLVGERFRDVAVTVTLSEATNDIVRVPFIVGGTATFGDDHDLENGAFLIAPGELTGTITFRVVHDDVLEGSENITLRLMAPLNAELGEAIDHEVSVEDRSLDLPVLSFETIETITNEGVVVEVVASIDRVSTNAVAALYEVGGTAESKVDHNLVNDVLIIPPGELSTTLSVTIFEDGIDEGQETVDIEIMSAINNAQLGEIKKHTIIIGEGTTDPTDPPTDPTNPPVPEREASIAIAGESVCAIREDKTVWCWGSNQYGEHAQGMGRTDTDAHPIPVQVPGLTNVAQIRGIGNGYIARTEDGKVYNWGRETDGTLGTATAGVSVRPFLRVFSGSDIVTDIYEAGRCYKTNQDVIKCWGVNSATGQLGFGRGDTPYRIYAPTEATVLTGKEFSFYYHNFLNTACFKEVGGDYKCWGTYSNGKAGTGTTSAPSGGNITVLPVIATELANFQIDSMTDNSYAVCFTSEGDVYCYGRNDFNNIGCGETCQRYDVFLSPFKVEGLPEGITQVKFQGSNYNCATNSGQSLWCWGRDIVTTEMQTAPVKIEGLGSVYDFIGTNSLMCANTATGVYCWGNSTKGVLGDSGITSSAVPVKINFPTN